MCTVRRQTYKEYVKILEFLELLLRRVMPDYPQGSLLFVLVLEFIKFNLDSVLMYCVCMHNFHSAHICMVYNSVKCVHFFIIKLILEL